MLAKMLLLFVACSVLGLTGCASSSPPVRQSEVREEISPQGSTAHQRAWEKGNVPEELRNQATETQAPIEGTQTTTSTTAPTGEFETPPSANPQGQQR